MNWKIEDAKEIEALGDSLWAVREIAKARAQIYTGEKFNRANKMIEETTRLLDLNQKFLNDETSR